MITKLFRDKKLKITKARIVIYEILKEENRGITAEYIYGMCVDRGYNINLSTVYRTLEIFEDKELIDKFNLEDDKKSYVLKKQCHNHMVECDLCHKEIQVPCPMQQLEEILKAQTGFKLTEHNLTLKGVCETCSKAKDKQS